jgi:hypothetical protein
VGCIDERCVRCLNSIPNAMPTGNHLAHSWPPFRCSFAGLFSSVPSFSTPCPVVAAQREMCDREERVPHTFDATFASQGLQGFRLVSIPLRVPLGNLKHLLFGMHETEK